jgi:hypothetical protein
MFNITNGFYTDGRYNEHATKQLMKDILVMNRIVAEASPIMKNKICDSRGRRLIFDRACSLCNNDAEYKYSNGLFTCDICHSSFLVGDYGKADIDYHYVAKKDKKRIDGIYYINHDRIKIIYSCVDGLFEHITIRKDALYTKYTPGKTKHLVYCDLCVVNKKRCGDARYDELCEICAKILSIFSWKKVLPIVAIIMWRIDGECEVKLCDDIKRYCLRFIL